MRIRQIVDEKRIGRNEKGANIGSAHVSRSGFRHGRGEGCLDGVSKEQAPTLVIAGERELDKVVNLDDTLEWDSPLRLTDSTSAPGRRATRSCESWALLLGTSA
jgi:hypothetical protein